MKTRGAKLFLATFALALATVAHAGVTTTYTYDALGRLVATSTTIDANNAVSTNLAYDPAGNRISYAVSAAASSGSAVVTNRANTTVTVLAPNRWEIRKTGGTDGAFDASAVSSMPFSGDFTLSAGSLSGTPNGFVAMNGDPATNDSYTSLDYSIQIYSDGKAYIYERGAFVLLFPIDQKVWLWREGTTIKYGTGADFATASTTGLKRTVSGAGGALYFDSSLSSSTSDFTVTLDGASSATAIANRANTTVTMLAADSWEIRKIGGTDGAFDASADSSTAFAGNFTLSGWSLSGTPNGFVAMNGDPATDSSYTSLDYSIQIYSDGKAYIYESGAFVLLFPIDQKVWLWREGTTIKYGTGADFAAASTTGLKRTVTGAVGSLYFDSSLSSSNSDFAVTLERP